MNRFPVAILLVLAVGSFAPAQTPFPDIAPCHWAAEAVSEIAGTPRVEIEQARNSVYLAENAVRQVLEGLRCGTSEWSRAFLAGEPEAWPGEVGKVSFALQVGGVRLESGTGTARVQLSLTIDGRTVERSGQVELVFREGTWRVTYPSLARLELPLFP
jgi:hypothetical protein